MVLYSGRLIDWNSESYPMQDEPEGEVRFQYKMSLERMAC
jgi:hypothetical protein